MARSTDHVIGYTWNWKRFEYNQDGSVNELQTIESGEPGVFYHGDKITGRFSHRWVNAVHEVNVTQPGYEERQMFVEGIKIYHFADNTKSRSSYLPLLLLDVEENPNNDRNMYYCARELYFNGRYEESIAMFKRHLVMPESVWGPERAWSMRYLAKMIPHEAEHWHLRACSEYKEGAETWTDLAKFYHGKEDWFNMFYAAKRALTCQLYKGLYLTEPDAYGWWPNDMVALSAHKLGYFKEALHHGQIAVDLNPDDQRLKDNLVWYKRALTGVTVVIPTKSNVSGLTQLISSLMSAEGVSRIVVVGDGTQTATMLQSLPSSVIKTYVPQGVGIHAMWNAGMALRGTDDHVLFLNDDVTIATGAIASLVTALIEDPRLGLVCPKYAGDSDVDIVTHSTCRGRYDGTGGMAGFAMMLAADLVPQWKFDERMKWWYGDDDLVNWVNRKAKRLCVIVGKARCTHAHSVTIDNDRPDNFNNIVEEDRKIFEKKWSN